MEAEGRADLYSRGFHSNDQMSGPISTALKRRGLHYNSLFVCIAVYSGFEDPHDERGPAYKAFGPPVILKESVFGELKIACAMDFQNAISNRRDVAKVFRNLIGKSPAEIQEELRHLISLRPSNTWTEARIYRELVPADISKDRYKSDISF